MQVHLTVDRDGKPKIKADIDFATGKVITKLELPITASPQEIADLATILTGDAHIQVVFSNPQLQLDDIFQNTSPGSNK